MPHKSLGIAICTVFVSFLATGLISQGLMCLHSNSDDSLLVASADACSQSRYEQIRIISLCTQSATTIITLATQVSST